MQNGTSDGIKNVTKSAKTTLETKARQHVENVPNLIPSDLQETRFRIEWLPKITKTRSADKYKKYQKMVSTWSQNPWKFGPETQQKTMLKNGATKIKKCSKNDLKIEPKEWLYIKGFASCGAFGGSNRFCDQEMGPQRSQSAPKTEKWARNDSREPVDCEKELQKDPRV